MTLIHNDAILIPPMVNTKPYVQMACICEKVLLEPNGVASLIRVVDKFEVTVPSDIPSGMTPGVPMTIYVGLKSGDLKGEFTAFIHSLRPDGTRGERFEWKPVFQGAAHGVQLKLDFMLAKPQTGIYWFDVIFEGEVLTSIPADITVVTQPANQQVATAGTLISPPNARA